MKKIIYLLSLISVTLFSCNQDIDYPFNSRDGIQFKHFDVTYNGTRVYFDSLSYSFGLKNDTILRDTLKLVVELMGNPSNQERTYSVDILRDSSTAVEGVHFETFSREQKFRANKTNDTLRIVIIREDLDKDYTNPKKKRLDFIVKESKDFALGLTKGRTMKVLLSDYLVEPVWWKGNFGTSLGYFHPKKWRILISFNDKFANEKTCPFDQNNEGKGYTTGLRNYLDNELVYDYVDGKKFRLKMYDMVQVEE